MCLGNHPDFNEMNSAIRQMKTLTPWVHEQEANEWTHRLVDKDCNEKGHKCEHRCASSACGGCVSIPTGLGGGCGASCQSCLQDCQTQRNACRGGIAD
jgi:hypothetical protein